MAGKDAYVFVGRKPISNYILACMTLCQNEAIDTCIKTLENLLTKTFERPRFFDIDFCQMPMSKMME
jgi:DNA-binding protein